MLARVPTSEKKPLTQKVSRKKTIAAGGEGGGVSDKVVPDAMTTKSFPIWLCIENLFGCE